MNKGILGLLFLILTLTGLGTYSLMLYEGWSLFDSFYFVLVTITTVGYGDIIPQTYEGRITSMLLIIFGVGTVQGTAGHRQGLIWFFQKKQKLNYKYAPV